MYLLYGSRPDAHRLRNNYYIITIFYRIIIILLLFSVTVKTDIMLQIDHIHFDRFSNGDL